MMKTFMFPGQGSQIKGMGGALFEELKQLTRQADDILGYSIKELCLEDPRNELSKTEFTQPAVYVVNALSYYRKIQDAATKPDFLAGHSLGEFNALLAAECFDFETGLKLVQKRGELMGRVSNGAMAAILNATKDEIETILRHNGLDNIDLANYNTPSQIVISGLADEIARAEACFQQGTMLYCPLNTSGAFHSRFMHAVQEEFRVFLATCNLSDCAIPVIANVTARPYQSGAIRENLTRQMTSTVRWSESIQYLMALGVERGGAMQFEELGCGDILTGLLKTIQTQTPDAVLERIVRQSTEARAGADRAAASAAMTQASSRSLKTPAQAVEQVARWNASHPIGTRVKSLIADYTDLLTRTEAVVLFGHRAAVYMKDYNGYFDLDEIVPA
jgi:malonyl CoA-acyl carrier protein transacylase